MRDIPADFPLSAAQQRVVDAVVTGQELIADELRDALTHLGPPSFYMDFETFSPALPVYPGTSPYERIPFQWSVHQDDGQGALRHSEFLAAGDLDPRREFAETLLSTLEGTAWPIIVYSSFESTALRDLAALFPDLAYRFAAIIDRLADLLPIIRKHVSHPAFLGSCSIKDVAPALVSGFDYADLTDVMKGDDASTVYYTLATARSLPRVSRLRYRAALLRYCCRDTLALMQVHRRLLSTDPK
jgi:hypothetical protein